MVGIVYNIPSSTGKHDGIVYGIQYRQQWKTKSPILN